VRKLAIVAQGYLDSLKKLTSTSESEMSAEGAEIERIASVAERGASDYDTLSGLMKAALRVRELDRIGRLEGVARKLAGIADRLARHSIAEDPDARSQIDALFAIVNGVE